MVNCPRRLWLGRRGWADHAQGRLDDLEEDPFLTDEHRCEASCCGAASKRRALELPGCQWLEAEELTCPLR